MESGAAIDVPSGPDGLTPLMVAASQVSPGEGGIFLPGSTRPLDVARDLIQRGANVNAQSKHGVTPLMIAAARNVTPMIGLLVQLAPTPISNRWRARRHCRSPSRTAPSRRPER
ncbi:MAG: ankyrin repeat domain-containing protein [Hyphomicrobium sp.]